ncbi:MAG TPA: DUF6600 domain-containing protein [Chthoniobacterales bacterium]
MKRILLALTMVGFLLPLAPRAQADPEVSLNLFYDNLSAQGNWIEVADYGYCFQPNVAVSNADWRPYSDGYWAYTDLGWTWVSYEDFGWATYHYGRWADLDSYGWVWVPGYEWGPAWVSWRTGGDYVGWAPLPPAVNRVYEGRAITGQVDVEFGIGPLYYNFVDIRYIGEPVLRSRILAPSRNVTIINRTVNVTNITYNNSVVYNYGPDYNRVNQFSTRPIQRLTIQRETNVGTDLTRGRKGSFNRVNGNQLTVVAPTIQKSQQKIAPKQVKAKVEKANVETGWKGINNRQQVEAEMKKGDPKNIPAPDFKPQKGRKAEATAGAAQGTDHEQQNAAKQQQNAAPGANDAGQQARQRQQREKARQQREQAQQNEPNVQAGQRAEGQRIRQEKRQNRPSESNAGEPNTGAESGQQDATSETPKQHRQQRAEERRAQRADQNDQGQAQPTRRQESDSAPQARKAENADENQPSDNSRPENNHPRRAQKADEAQAGPAADQNAGAPPRAEQRANRPHRQMQQRRLQQQEQASPQQQQQRSPGTDNPNNERKGKKKKPNDEQPPQP